MRLFKRRKTDRRLPQNKEKRKLIDQLKKAEDTGQKLAVEHKLEEAQKRTEAVEPRIAYLRRTVKVLRRS